MALSANDLLAQMVEDAAAIEEDVDEGIGEETEPAPGPSTSEPTPSSLPRGSVARTEFDSSDEEMREMQELRSLFTEQEIVRSTRAERDFEKLRFNAPGKNMWTPDPSLSRASRRRQAQQQKPKNNKWTARHDNKGNLIVKGENKGRLCDCLVIECNGCWSRCEKCNTEFCSYACQRNRANVLLFHESEGRPEATRYNPYVPQTVLDKLL